MKFLVLFACIAAASAVSSYYPWYRGGETWDTKHSMYPTYGGDMFHKKFMTPTVWNKDFYGKDYYGKDFYGKDFYNKGFYGKDFYGKDFYGKDFYNKGFYGKDFENKDFYGKDFYGMDFHNKDFYNKDFYGKDFNFGLGGDIGHFLGTKDFSTVKKDFVLFYYKYLLEILDLFKVRFGDILTHYDTFTLDSFILPVKCHKLTGLIRWMMMTNVDVTKYDIHVFDSFMMCKMVDYVLFIKNYFYHFDMSVMYKDYGLIRDWYGMLGEHGYGLNKYYGDIFSHDYKYFGGLGDKYGSGLIHY